MTDHTMEEKRNHAVLVGLHASSLPGGERQRCHPGGIGGVAGNRRRCVRGQCAPKSGRPPRPEPSLEREGGGGGRLVQAKGRTWWSLTTGFPPPSSGSSPKRWGAQVIDRAGLILDIFAQRARTRRGGSRWSWRSHKYLLPRLTGYVGAPGSQTASGKIPHWNPRPRRNPAETDRRHIRRKIAKLTEDLEEVRRVRRSSGTAGRRMRSPWWPLWAIPTPASPPSSMP